MGYEASVAAHSAVVGIIAERGSHKFVALGPRPATAVVRNALHLVSCVAQRRLLFAIGWGKSSEGEDGNQ